MYQTQVPPKSKKVARKQERQCIYAQTQQIGPEVPTIITPDLRIQDESRPKTSSQLRAIILVGHSIREDLRILHFLGMNTSNTAPILAVIDTHTISRFILPSYHPRLSTITWANLLIDRRVSPTRLLATNRNVSQRWK